MDSVVSLHKYFLWATYMAAELQREMPKVPRPISWAHPKALHAFMFMSYWYSALYVVTEGWRRLRLTDPAVDALLAERGRLRLLKEYRHGVYHFQPDYFDRRYQDLVDQGQPAMEWLHKLHAAFTAYFSRWFETHNLDGTLK